MLNHATLQIIRLIDTEKRWVLTGVGIGVWKFHREHLEGNMNVESSISRKIKISMQMKIAFK
jgi:hypothetical protein